ncbi:MAG: hypothetical protein KGI54_01660 [Pseudomonadota bacterium]|nr:hypothetical protein [Pseudomonadota bacterium]
MNDNYRMCGRSTASGIPRNQWTGKNVDFRAFNINAAPDMRNARLVDLFRKEISCGYK